MPGTRSWSSSSRRRRRRRSRSTSATATRSRPRSGTSATSSSPRTCRPSSRRARSASSRSTSRTTSTPYYVVTDAKKKTVADLKRALKDADELYLATDEDREGEAIAWHLLEVLKPKVPVQADGVPRDHQGRDPGGHEQHPRARHRARRRAGDPPHPRPPLRLRGLAGALAQGRARALRRSRAVRRHPPRRRPRARAPRVRRRELLGPDRTSCCRTTSAERSAFESRLARLDGKRVASGPRLRRPRPAQGRRRRPRRGGSRGARRRAAPAEHRVHGRRIVESKPYTRRPAAPFTTSTLQQEAARKLRFSARQTMSVAQSLYENGYITYMRTDSPTLSQQAIKAARSQAAKLYGAETVPEKPRVYTGKIKNAQEAHEAIRPSGETFRTPSELPASLRGNDFKLYDLIWKRTVASQMADAQGSTASVTITRARPTRRRTPPSSRRPAPSSPSAASSRPTKRATTRSATSRMPPRPTSSAAAAADRGQVLDLGERRGQGPRDQPAAALHRGEPGQDARRAGHRPPVDLREHHLDDHRPRLRHPARHGARAELDRVQRRPPARGVLRRPGRVRLHGRAWRTTSTASPTARRTASTG